MKAFNKSFSILVIAIIAWFGTAAVFGQAKTMSKEDFDNEIKKAFEAAEKTFPRRETESKPKRRQIFEENRDEPSEIILNERSIREFLTKDKIRYEFEKETATGKTLTKRMQINSDCYESDGNKWKKVQDACDPIIYTATGGADKEGFFLEDGTLDSKPVKILRNVRTGRVYADGKPPYVNEYLYYFDSAGRLVKFENLTKQGEEKAVVDNSTTYEYDIKIAPVSVPKVNKETKKRG